MRQLFLLHIIHTTLSLSPLFSRVLYSCKLCSLILVVTPVASASKGKLERRGEGRGRRGKNTSMGRDGNFTCPSLWMLELLYEFRDNFAYGMSSRNAFCSLLPLRGRLCLSFLRHSKHSSFLCRTPKANTPPPRPAFALHAAVPALAKNHIRKRGEINFHL